MRSDNTKRGNPLPHCRTAQPVQGNASRYHAGTGYGYQPLAQRTRSGLRPRPNTGFKLRYTGKLVLLLGGAALLGVTLWGGMASMQTRRRLEGDRKEGTISYSNGDVYTGELLDGKADGFGKMIYKVTKESVEAAYYVGGFKENHRTEGAIFGLALSDGGIYNGDWKYGKLDGRGEAIFSDYTYKGEWANDTWKRGKYTWTDNGDYYEGEFAEGVPHGSGKMVRVADSCIKDGQWLNGKFIESTPQSSKPNAQKKSKPVGFLEPIEEQPEEEEETPESNLEETPQPDEEKGPEKTLTQTHRAFKQRYLDAIGSKKDNSNGSKKTQQDIKRGGVSVASLRKRLENAVSESPKSVRRRKFNKVPRKLNIKGDNWMARMNESRIGTD